MVLFSPQLDHGYALHTAAKDCFSSVVSQDVQTPAEKPRAIFYTNESDPVSHCCGCCQREVPTFQHCVHVWSQECFLEWSRATERKVVTPSPEENRLWPCSLKQDLGLNKTELLLCLKAPGNKY